MPDMPENLIDPLDYGSLRKAFYQSAFDGISSRYPLENDRYRIEVDQLEYVDPEDYSIKDQKKAILQMTTLGRRLKGQVKLINKADGSIVDKKKTTLAVIPHLTNRGTYIVGGNEYTVSNQMRLRAGPYVRVKTSGEPEAHFNVFTGGPSFRILMEPDTGVFRLNVGQANLNAMPILKAIGIRDDALRAAWGDELYNANVQATAKDDASVKKAWERLARVRGKTDTGEQPSKDLRVIFDGMRIDPRVTRHTLGMETDRITPDLLLAATQKVISRSRGDVEDDNRDSLAYQELWTASDMLKERFDRDAGRLAHKLLWKATARGNLNHLSPRYFDSQVTSLFYGSGVAQPLEEVNLLDNTDQNMRVLRIGEGGMSDEAVPDAARNVQPTHMLFIDPIRSPESGSVGVDSRFTVGVKLGPNKTMYAGVKDRKGKMTYIDPETLANSVIAFPGEKERAVKEGRKRLLAMNRGKLEYVDTDVIDYFADAPSDLFTHGSNLVPLVSGIKGGRLLMGAKMRTQALPIISREAPLVQSLDKDGKTFDAKLSKYVAAIHSDVAGTVMSVDKDAIKVKDAAGNIREYELYNNMPLNRKTFITNIPKVQPGDIVKPGKLLAASNMTDDEGTVALGANLRVGYIPYKGLNYEDAVVISESAAKKLASEHMYTESMDLDKLITSDRRKFMSIFPSKYTKAQLDKVDDNGVAKPGVTLEKGDPIILAVRRRTSKGAGMLHRGGASSFIDDSVTWEHDFPGEITDFWQDKNGLKVAIKGYAPMEVGDKLAGFYGDKGIVSAVVPDDQVPKGEDGQPLEILVNPLGVISRVNPSQIYETILGKIAKKRGKPYYLPGFTEDDLNTFVEQQMAEHGVKDTETIYDPALNRNIEGVLTGVKHYMKLHHTVDAKQSSRAIGAYSMEGTPVRTMGEKDKPKRVGIGEMSALIAHGAVNNIRELKAVKGQRNDDYWKALTLGYSTPEPDIPNAYKKLFATMKAAGINVERRGNNLHLLAMTDRDIDEISAGEIKEPELVKWTSKYGKGVYGEQSMDPISGGLLDRGITGGHGGNRWGHIVLSEPMPQPVMEDPIRYMLGLTRKDYHEVIAGRKDIPGIGTGGKAIREALRRINIDRAIAADTELIKTTGNANARDAAIKRLKYYQTFKKTQMKPEDLVVTKIPVIPPIFRPVTANSAFSMVAGPNKLYMDLMHSNRQLKESSEVLTGQPVTDARLTLYNAMKAVTGLGDPINPVHQKQGVSGFLKDIFGSSPKSGHFQRELIGTPVDFSGRTTIVPNPNLNMDEIGIPEDQAWKLYGPFVVRRLIKSMGNRPEAQAAAIKMVINKDAKAKEHLIAEMSERPVLSSRAPALHKYSIMGFYPKIAPGKALELAPPIVTGFNADFDGDNMNFHVVVTDDAIREVNEKLLPSRNVRSGADFGPMWLPRQEFLQGLYAASTKRNGKKMLPTYNSVSEVISAFKRGEVDVSDVITVLDK